MRLLLPHFQTGLLWVSSGEMWETIISYGTEGKLAHTLVYSVGKSFNLKHIQLSLIHTPTLSRSLSYLGQDRGFIYISGTLNSGEPTSRSRSFFSEIPSGQLFQVGRQESHQYLTIRSRFGS